MWKDFAVYIANKCSPSDKVVEVGVGKFNQVSNYLKEHYKIIIILTDIKPSHQGVVEDDITKPQKNLYKNARLIYSIRPPGELHQPLMDISDKTGAILIIKPLTNEDILTSKKMRLVNYNKAFFYIYP
ncbi:MAG: hypothetical protein KKF16_11130 [Euryarchaeota archaeon]|nr:hypothetical protein [Euryarchaeota archaeon]MBU4548067.1 hypothetical protein [Euryarchaeota archaeon]MBV1729313.1 hypothetical protein [Methanobacterium sp.]MBV1755581.1 hypothetical protein [Methanobacterium sp.]MBV1767444.1 hypothetical protein [Methanobacterium sp.]